MEHLNGATVGIGICTTLFLTVLGFCRLLRIGERCVPEPEIPRLEEVTEEDVEKMKHYWQANLKRALWHISLALVLFGAATLTGYATLLLIRTLS
jgi:hypothetical protein